MIDIETLSLDPQAAIHEIAMVPFDIGVVGPPVACFHAQFTPISGAVDIQTICWGIDNCPPARARMPEANAVQMFQNYQQEVRGCQFLWAKPSSFDPPRLLNWINRNELGEHCHEVFTNFRRWRDSKSFILAGEMMGIHEESKAENAHNALSDALAQATHVATVMERLHESA